ncbi:hypothetical protein ACVDFE_04405 [Lentzea chajnantorensis]
MTREFEISKEVEVGGTPEQVWDAIATGPGIDSWFMGPHTVDGRLGGRMSLDLGFFQEKLDDHGLGAGQAPRLLQRQGRGRHVPRDGVPGRGP